MGEYIISLYDAMSACFCICLTETCILNFPPRVHAVTRHTREVVLRITVVHDNKQALAVFGMEIAPAATCMAPGITGGGGGRPHPSPNLVHFSCLVAKSAVPAKLAVGTETRIVGWSVKGDEKSLVAPVLEGAAEVAIVRGMTKKVPLIKLAYGRSGDKGDSANIGILLHFLWYSLLF